MSVNQLKFAANGTSVFRLDHVMITSRRCARHSVFAKVNVTAPLTRSQSLQNITTAAMRGVRGQKEQ